MAALLAAIQTAHMFLWHPVQFPATLLTYGVYGRDLTKFESICFYQAVAFVLSQCILHKTASQSIHLSSSPKRRVYQTKNRSLLCGFQIAANLRTEAARAIGSTLNLRGTTVQGHIFLSAEGAFPENEKTLAVRAVLPGSYGYESCPS